MTALPDSIPASAPWYEALRTRGAILAGTQVLHFGDPEGERTALLAAPSVHPLADWTLLRAQGADAASFLQGQLSNDIESLDQSRAQLSTYCTAQGRMLASLLVWGDPSGFVLQLPGEIAETVRARLQKHVLRAKVGFTDATGELALFGLAGPGATAALRRLVAAPPDLAMGVARADHLTAIRLHGELFEVVVRARDWGSVWDRLTREVRAAGSGAWMWRLIQAGIPVVTAATQDQFVPQMANFDLLGAISFTKGCYPGQEVVARVQYRGEVKRRLFRLHAPSVSPQAGQSVFRFGQATACGTVMNAAAAPRGGFDLLAVLSLGALDAADLRLGSADGPPLRPCH